MSGSSGSMDFGIGESVSGIFGVTEQYANAKLQKNLNRLQQDFASQQAQYAFDRNLKMWQMQNEYNTPLQQMKRFEEAGLNKNLIFGQGTPGNATNYPQYTPAQWHPTAPKIDLGKVVSMMNAYRDLRIKDVQIDNMNRIGKNLDLENVSKGIENAFRSTEKQYQLQKIRTELNLSNQKALESQRKQGLTEEQTRLAKHQGEALDTEIQLKQIQEKNQQIMNRILNNQQAYEQFKQNYIKENKYSPESSPTLFRMIQDIIKSFTEGASELFNAPNQPTEINPLGK